MSNSKQYDKVNGVLRILWNDRCYVSRNINNFFNKLHMHNYYEIEFVLSGRAVHHVNNTVQILSSGDAVFLRPEDTHFFVSCDIEDAKYVSYNIRISNEVMENKFLVMDEIKRKISYSPTPQVMNFSSAEISSIIKKLDKISNAAMDNEELIFLYDTVLYQMFSQVILKKHYQYEPVIPKWFEEYLTMLSKKEVFVSDYSEIMNMSNVSKSYLCKMFKKHTGVTPSEYINNLKLDYAYDLVLHSNYSFVTIATMAGYNSYAYFFRKFVSKFNKKPGDVRNASKIIVNEDKK